VKIIRTRSTCISAESDKTVNTDEKKEEVKTHLKNTTYCKHYYKHIVHAINAVGE